MNELKVEVCNSVRVSGEVESNPKFSHLKKGVKYFSITLLSERMSGTIDRIPVLIPTYSIDDESRMSVIKAGVNLRVTGAFHSHNKVISEHKTRLILHVVANGYSLMQENEECVNEVSLNGFICKEPVYRKTPLGREISDVLLAVNSVFDVDRRSDYIPCIFWGKGARDLSTYQPGIKVNVKGRLQSRSYNKMTETGEWQNRHAFELSVYDYEVVLN